MCCSYGLIVRRVLLPELSNLKKSVWISYPVMLSEDYFQFIIDKVMINWSVEEIDQIQWETLNLKTATHQFKQV